MYKYFLNAINNKKGYTFVEVMTVVIILGVLAAVAVPMYFGISKQQKIKECQQQAQILQTVVQQAMAGMYDSGMKQDMIYAMTNDICFDSTVKFGFIRGGYRADHELGINEKPTYETCCQETYKDSSDHDVPGYKFLKKFDMKDRTLASFLISEELPVCPFAEDNIKNESVAITNTLTYYIRNDGTVYCICPECVEAAAD